MNNTLFAKLSWCLLAVFLISVLMERSSAQSPSKAIPQAGRFQLFSRTSETDNFVYRMDTVTGETFYELRSSLDKSIFTGQGEDPKQKVRLDFWVKIDEKPQLHDLSQTFAELQRSLSAK
jgi:hypothetical protein